MSKIRDADCSLIDQNENSLCHTLLFDKENMNDSDNAHILNPILFGVSGVAYFIWAGAKMPCPCIF